MPTTLRISAANPNQFVLFWSPKRSPKLWFEHPKSYCLPGASVRLSPKAARKALRGSKKAPIGFQESSEGSQRGAKLAPRSPRPPVTVTVASFTAKQ